MNNRLLSNAKKSEDSSDGKSGLPRLSLRNVKGFGDQASKPTAEKHLVQLDRSDISDRRDSKPLEDLIGNGNGNEIAVSNNELNLDLQNSDIAQQQDASGSANTTGLAKFKQVVDIQSQKGKSNKPGSVADLNMQKTSSLPTKKQAKGNDNPGASPKLLDVVTQSLGLGKNSSNPSPMKIPASGKNSISSAPEKDQIRSSVNATVAFARDFTNNKVKTSNVKVVARVRPMNTMELELRANGVGSECISFPSENMCQVMPENQAFTLDRFFKPDCQQSEIYDFIGKDTIEDVLAGYNGTVFAYGQTGSGKTFTMYGAMHDPELRGLIPRSSEHIFEYINALEEEVDISIKCSMLEIYKENLYDLLAGDKTVSDKPTVDLKIKENPRRGIYIEGLTEEDVGSSEELMELLELGEKQRTVAATRMNNYSSRSHSLFIMEIIQRFTNEAEKRGRLNLVDLAGSEKVGKTGATGETLEEAKKINLSLSCLGFVIHALTSGYEHIPYRDSKLTRILQESLGGNYKTTLIVACSPYSSNKEETITTLKFAARAKTIKNQVKMNIQNSPEALMAVIEGLKAELDDCRMEISKLRETGGIPGGIPGGLSFGSGPEFAQQRNWSRFKNTKVEGGGLLPLEDSEKYSTEDFLKHARLDTFDPKANMEKIKQEIALNRIQMEADDLSKNNSKIVGSSLQFLKDAMNDTLTNKDDGKGLIHKKDYHSYTYYKTNLELLSINENLSLRLANLTKDMEIAGKEIASRDRKIKEQEAEIILLKNQLLDYEKKVSAVTEQSDLYELKVNSKIDNLEQQRVTIEVLEKQINAISEALTQGDQEVERLLSEKSRLINSKFLDFMSEDAKFRVIKLPDYFLHSFNFNYEPFYDQVPKNTYINPDYHENNKYLIPVSLTQNGENPGTAESQFDDRLNLLEEEKLHDVSNLEKISFSEKASQMQNASPLGKRSSQQTKDSFITGLDLQNAFNNAENNLKEIVEIPHAVQAVLSKLSSNGPLKDALEEQNNMSPEFIIYVLKQQLLQASVINQHLERTISVLEWKQVIEYGKAKIKSYYTKMQERHIANLEKVLDKARFSHAQLRKRVEDVELETIKLRESGLNGGSSGFDNHKAPAMASKAGTKARILRSVKHDQRKSAKSKETPVNAQNQPVLSLVPEVSMKVDSQLKTSKEQEKAGSLRLQTETESHEDENSKKDQKLSFSFAAGTASKQNLGNLNNEISSFLKDIEFEIKSSGADPATFEEAKQFIGLKNSIILKLKNFVSNSISSGFYAEQQNLIDYLKYDNDRLENKLLLFQTELGVEKTRSEQIKEAFNEQKKQMSKLNELNRELELAATNALKTENQSWQKIIDEIKATHTKEIVRKQEEVAKLHDMLAGWVFRYMEIQESKNIAPTHAEKLLYEAFKRREFPAKQLIEKALGSSRSAVQLNTSLPLNSPKKPTFQTIASSPKLNTSLNSSVTDLRKGQPKYYFGNFLKF